MLINKEELTLVDHMEVMCDLGYGSLFSTKTNCWRICKESRETSCFYTTEQQLVV